ncbi:MAG: cold shock domain-containing protein [Bacteroidota bacterium]
MKTGTIKFYNTAKGFGFIKLDENGQDIFVHSTSLKGPVREGDKVQFQVEDGKKGLTAIQVSLC